MADAALSLRSESRPAAEPGDELTQNLPDKSHQQATAELIESVDALLSHVSNIFSGISAELFTKLGDIHKRIEALEGTLQTQLQEENAGSRQSREDIPAALQVS